MRSGSVRRGIERGGRALLVWVLGLLFGVRRRPVELGPRPRILVVRIDERVGNLVMLTPVLSSLRARYPGAELDLLAHHRGAALLDGHPALTRFLAFDKRRLAGRRGPLATPFVLRRRRYDLVIDAANPTDPSTTQAIFVLLSGAPHRVGYAEGAFARFYTAPVTGAGAGPHEIDMRLALLDALPGTGRVRATSLAPVGPAPAPRAAPYGLVNVGARMGHKRLSAQAYAAVARRVLDAGLGCVVTYGPAEEALAAQTVALARGAALAAPTGLAELAALMKGARAVVTCDTGPMHVSVATGAPTCGLFVDSEPARYGYAEPPHAAVDVRGRDEASWLAEVDAWLRQRLARAAGNSAS